MRVLPGIALLLDGRKDRGGKGRGDQSHTLPLPLPSRERKENRGVQATGNPDEPK